MKTMPYDLKEAIEFYGWDAIMESFPEDMQDEFRQIRLNVRKPVFIR
jgi:hypothetical protein